MADTFETDVYRSGSDDTFRGREGPKALRREYCEAFPDLEGEFVELLAEGDRVAFFREDYGTHEGEFRGIPPTGEEITFEYAGYAVIDDGEIVYLDALGSIMILVKQMGVDLPIES